MKAALDGARDQPWRQAAVHLRFYTAMKRIGEQTPDLVVNDHRRRSDGGQLTTGVSMLYWALVFLVIAIIAGLLGFGGIASASAGVAQILFFIFLILLAVSLVMYFVRGRRPPA